MFMERLQTSLVGEYVGELVFFLFKIGESMLDPTIRLYIYKSTCEARYPNEATCYELQDYPQIEDEVQQQSGTYIMAYKILVNLPAIVLGLFCGAWSDKIGRKIPVMLPCMGTIFAVLCFMSSMMVGSDFLPLVLVGAGIRGAFGKSAVITMALHSYVTDLSSKEDRTRRIGGLLAMNMFGYFAGSLIAGALLDVYSFNVVFCTVVGINALSVLMAMFLMRESLPVHNEEEGSEKKSRNPFKTDYIRESLSVITEPRKNHARVHLCLLFATVILQQLCKSGETDALLLFVERSPLTWRKSTYGYLLACDYAFLGLSVLCLLPLFSVKLKQHDMCLIACGIGFKMLRLLIYSASNTSWMVFVACIITGPSAFIVSAAKSMISKEVRDDEIGKAFSLLSCGETVSNMFGTVIFVNIYSLSAHVFPGLVFALDAVLQLIWLVVILLLIRDMMSQNTYNLLEEDLPKSYGTTENLAIAQTQKSEPPALKNGGLPEDMFVYEDKTDGSQNTEKSLEECDSSQIRNGIPTKRTVRMDFRKQPDTATPENIEMQGVDSQYGKGSWIE